ncbi:MAG: hypothetical protein KatS3mg105_1209 [Gemmatales bacterium]|nr:MAG: hypothetical protein KatS3mg105_1209 [Gemmatales bacterium]
MRFFVRFLAAALAILLSTDAISAQKFELKKGDHICIVGNALAERMQYFGWLETHLQTRFPNHQLVVRNLGFSGDEIKTRLRSANFGSPDEYLKLHRADVIFAFFGFNESFAGKNGVEQFKKDLTDYIDHVRSQKYNGSNPPRVVLFSPVAHENLRTKGVPPYRLPLAKGEKGGWPDLPDGRENNERIRLYSEAMAEVGQENEYRFRRSLQRQQTALRRVRHTH